MENQKIDNQIKLSQLLGEKKLKFIDGKAIWTSPADKLNGDIIFKDIIATDKVFTQLTKQMKKKELTTMEYLFKLIPILTNMIVDIKVDEFEKNASKPNFQLKMFLVGLSNHMMEIMEASNAMIKTQKEIGEIAQDIQLNLPQKSELEQKQEAFEFLTKAYKEEKDTKLKHELFVKKAVLRAEIEEIEELEENNKLNEVTDK